MGKNDKSRIQTEKYFKRQFSTLLIGVGVALSLIGIAFTLASQRTQYMGLVMLVPGSAMWVVGAAIHVKGSDLDNRMNTYTDDFKKNFYEGMSYTTKKVVLPVPHITCGYILDGDKYRSRRGGDGKLRTEECCITGLVIEKDQSLLMIKSSLCSLVGGETSTECFCRHFFELSEIKPVESEQNALSKNYSKFTAVCTDKTEFSFLLSADAEADAVIDDVQSLIEDAKKRKAQQK
ncbi:MAG TPA: hypothetical protein PLT66_03145 [Bacillota bacterium]|nr:hypothetical protein [Bacillota bacterium]